MNIWRMKLRAGNHGDDMWPICRERGIAAITYQAIFHTNLSRLSKRDLDPGVKFSARSSILRFAWEIKGGDEILVGDSISKCVIARGFVSSNPGKRAYRYNARNPIREPGNPNVPWRHEVPVDWDAEFEPFPYRDGAPQHTVMHFDPAWVQPSEGARSLSAGSGHESDSDDAAPLNEEGPGRIERFVASILPRSPQRSAATKNNRSPNW